MASGISAGGSPIVVSKHSFEVFPTDLNGDGQLDIIFGDDEGNIYYQMRDNLSWDESPQKPTVSSGQPSEDSTQP